MTARSKREAAWEDWWEDDPSAWPYPRASTSVRAKLSKHAAKLSKHEAKHGTTHGTKRTKREALAEGSHEKGSKKGGRRGTTGISKEIKLSVAGPPNKTISKHKIKKGTQSKKSKAKKPKKSKAKKQKKCKGR